MTLAFKIAGYCVLHAVLSSIGTTSILSFAQNGGDPRVVNLTREVENLSDDVAELRQQIQTLHGRQVNAPVGNSAVQYVFVSDRNTEAERHDERVHAAMEILARENN